MVNDCNHATLYHTAFLLFGYELNDCLSVETSFHIMILKIKLNYKKIVTKTSLRTYFGAVIS